MSDPMGALDDKIQRLRDAGHGHASAELVRARQMYVRAAKHLMDAAAASRGDPAALKSAYDAAENAVRRLNALQAEADILLAQ